VMYLMSFLTLGIFWVGQQTQLNHLERSDRHLTWINLAFLFAVTLLPFSTKLLAEFYSFRTALLVYWLNIVLLGAWMYAAWGYAFRHKLLKAEMPQGVPAAVCRRIVIAQSLYAAGATLCIWDTRLSIAAIVTVQLFYVLAPGFHQQH
ncbi:MAG TPA: TMEM175 family protein, partial [Opitutaceae bacterium]